MGHGYNQRPSLNTQVLSLALLPTDRMVSGKRLPGPEFLCLENGNDNGSILMGVQRELYGCIIVKQLKKKEREKERSSVSPVRQRWVLRLKTHPAWDFPGGPAVKTLPFNAGG